MGQWFVLLLVVAATIAFVTMVRQLLVPLVLAAIFSGLLHPVLRRAKRLCGDRSSLAAALVLLGALLAVGLPLTGLSLVVASEAVEMSQKLGPYVSNALSGDTRLADSVPSWARVLVPDQSQLTATVSDWTGRLAGGLVGSVSRATQGTLVFVLQLGVLLYAMFFFLRNGRDWLDAVVSYLPLRASAREIILERGLEITRATVLSILVIGVMQGLLVGLAFWVAGVAGAAFWGALVVPASAIPGLGAPLIWVPGALYLAVTNQIGWAIAVAVWGAVVVGLVDNVLRARLLGARTQLPDLLVLVATLGGIATFGPIGIILGPVLAGLLMTVLELYRETWGDVAA